MQSLVGFVGQLVITKRVGQCAHLLAELLHGDERAHGQDEVVHKVVGRLSVQQPTHDLGCFARVDLLHIPLDVAQHVVGVQVLREVSHHVEAVAHVDEWPAVAAKESLASRLHKGGGHTLNRAL